MLWYPTHKTWKFLHETNNHTSFDNISLKVYLYRIGKKKKKESIQNLLVFRDVWKLEKHQNPKFNTFNTYFNI